MLLHVLNQRCCFPSLPGELFKHALALLEELQSARALDPRLSVASKDEETGQTRDDILLWWLGLEVFILTDGTLEVCDISYEQGGATLAQKRMISIDSGEKKG